MRQSINNVCLFYLIRQYATQNNVGNPTHIFISTLICVTVTADVDIIFASMNTGINKHRLFLAFTNDLTLPPPSTHY